MTDDITRDAIDRIARTADGLILYRHLQEIVMEVTIGALRHHNGRRSLARDLMTLMGEGIAASGGRTDTFISRRAAEPAKRRVTPREFAASLPAWSADYAPVEPAADDSGAA